MESSILDVAAKMSLAIQGTPVEQVIVAALVVLDAPTEGSLIITGKSVAGLSEDELVEVRRGVLGFVFQQFSLLPTLTVSENDNDPPFGEFRTSWRGFL